MTEIELFTAALELETPWKIKSIKFEEKEKGKELHIYIDHEKRVKFKYEGELCSVHDHHDRTWKHLRFFQHECYLHAKVPRVKTKEGKVKLVEVPWGKPGSSFTLLFEYNVLDLAREGMSMIGVGRRLGISDKRVFGILRRHVSHALATQELETVKELSVDETSTKRGHSYFTVLADRVRKKVVGLSVGKDKEAFKNALLDMEIRGSEREKVKAVTMDMSRSYIAGANEFIDQAAIVFDRFHIAKQMNKAVDQIRREEQKKYNELNKSRYLWLKNSNKLNKDQEEKVSYLASTYPTIGEAYRLKELLKQVMDNAYQCQKITPLNEWIKEAWKSNIKPIRKFINMLRDHWYGVKEYFKRLATNAFAERVNLKIQEIKRIAKGYRNIDNFRIMIYFNLGGLNFKTHCK